MGELPSPKTVKIIRLDTFIDELQGQTRICEEPKSGSTEDHRVSYAYSVIIMIRIDQVIRTDRKSIALIVKRDGELIVRAPRNATDEQIFSVINRKSSWIEKKRQEVLSTYPQTGKKEFVNGEGFLYLGKSYRLKIISQGDVPLKLDKFFF